MLLGPSGIWRVREKIKRKRLMSKSGQCFLIVSRHGPGTRLRRPVRWLPPRHWLRFGFAAVGATAPRTFSQGCKTTRERNLNARAILITVA